MSHLCWNFLGVNRLLASSWYRKMSRTFNFSEQEVWDVMDRAMHLSSSPFVAFDRWMEAIGSPPPPRWIRYSGVPLQAWNSSIGGLHWIYSLSCSLHVWEKHPNPRPVWRYWQVGFASSRFRSPFMLVIFWSLSRSKKIRSIWLLCRGCCPPPTVAQVWSDRLLLLPMATSVQILNPLPQDSRSGLGFSDLTLWLFGRLDLALAPMGHGLNNGERLCSFLCEVGWPISSAPTNIISLKS